MNGFTLVPLNTDIVFVPGVILNLHNVRGHRDEWIHTRILKYRYSFFPHAINQEKHLVLNHVI